MEGYYSVTYSPDDGGFYAEFWEKNLMSPVFPSAMEAQQWAIKHGGTRMLNPVTVPSAYYDEDDE